MTYAVGAILLAVSIVLLWLVVTERWRFPLLFDFGLTLLMFGIAANGIQLATNDDPSLRAWFVSGCGAILMLASYAKECLRAARQDRLGSINRQIMRGRR